MYTVKTNGVWNLYNASKCVVRKGSFADIVEAMKEMW